MWQKEKKKKRVAGRGKQGSLAEQQKAWGRDHLATKYPSSLSLIANRVNVASQPFL